MRKHLFSVSRFRRNTKIDLRRYYIVGIHHAKIIAEGENTRRGMTRICECHIRISRRCRNRRVRQYPQVFSEEQFSLFLAQSEI